MKLKLQIAIVFLTFYSFVAQAQQVKNYSDINFTDNGQTANFNGSLYTGQVVDKGANGKQNYQAFYKNGLLDGIATEWDENGKKESEISYSSGKKDGKSLYFDESGVETQEINYKADSLDGDWTMFRNGSKRTVSKYVNGMLMGNQVFSSDGKPDSTWTNYDSNGNATYTYYHNGVEDKYSHYIVSNYTFNGPVSYLLKVPVSYKSGEYAEFVINNPAPTDDQYTKFINKIADWIAKIRGAKFIKPSDVAPYNNDTISHIVNLTNVTIKVSQYEVNNSNGSVTEKYNTNLDADLITTNLHSNTTTTTHIHSNNPAIGFGFTNNTPEWSFNSAVDRDLIKTAITEYLNINFPIKASIFQIEKATSKGEATIVTLNKGTQDFIVGDMKFKFCGTGASTSNSIELRVKETSIDHCTCKVLSGGDKIAEMMKQPGAAPLFVLEK